MTEPLHKQSIASLKRLFSSLKAPAADMRQGFYRAEFIGPWWLRFSGRPSVAISGLPGWQGKRFLTHDTATNILRNGDKQTEALSMRCVQGDSQVDGQLGIALYYSADAPVPWRWVRDELRAIDANRILGMTVINVPLLNKLSFPFLLIRDA